MWYEYLIFFAMLAGPIALYVKVRPLLAPVEVIDDQRVKCESPIERTLYIALVNNGYDVKTQVPCGRYRIDMTLPSHRIAIEADGKAYHSSPKQRAHDRRKNAYLRKQGWTVLRFSGRQIYKDMPKILRRIEDSAKKPAP